MEVKEEEPTKDKKIPNEGPSAEKVDDEFSEDVQRLKQMKKQQVQQLRDAREMVEQLEQAITKIDGQLEYIQYKRQKDGSADEDGSGVVETKKREHEG